MHDRSSRVVAAATVLLSVVVVVLVVIAGWQLGGAGGAVLLFVLFTARPLARALKARAHLPDASSSESYIHTLRQRPSRGADVEETGADKPEGKAS